MQRTSMHQFFDFDLKPQAFLFPIPLCYSNYSKITRVAY